MNLIKEAHLCFLWLLTSYFVTPSLCNSSYIHSQVSHGLSSGSCTRTWGCTLVLYVLFHLQEKRKPILRIFRILGSSLKKELHSLESKLQVLSRYDHSYCMVDATLVWGARQASTQQLYKIWSKLHMTRGNHTSTGGVFLILTNKFTTWSFACHMYRGLCNCHEDCAIVTTKASKVFSQHRSTSFNTNLGDGHCVMPDLSSTFALKDLCHVWSVPVMKKHQQCCHSTLSEHHNNIQYVWWLCYINQ